MMPFSTRLSTEQIAAVVGFIRFKFMGINPDKDTGGAPMAQVVGTSATTHQVQNKAPVKTSTAVRSPEPKPASRPHAGGIPGVDTSMAVPGTMSGTMPGAASGGHVINVDMSEAMPNKLKANIKWGREFYMKNCFTCHGVKGEGDGPRAYFNRPRPRNFTSKASRQILNRPRVFDSIAKGRVGTVMPAWGKVLTEQEIANLTEFVFQAFILGKGVQGKGAAASGKADSPAPVIKETETGKKKAS